MSEMLANRYFLSGRFAEAALEFDNLRRKEPHRLMVRMKLVICHTMAEKPMEALTLAMDILEEPSGIALQIDHRIEEFSCKEAVERFQASTSAMTPGMYHLSLGLLRLFCDEQGAVRELNLALEQSPELNDVRRLKTLVERHLEAGHA